MNPLTKISKTFMIVIFICLAVQPIAGFAMEDVEVKDPWLKEWLDIMGEKLQRDVEWEEKWVGKTINASNIDQLKNLVEPVTYEVIKNMGGCLKIVPARFDWRPSPSYIKATKENMGKAYIDENGVLQNYISGLPFPKHNHDPLKMAWNRDRGDYQGDDWTVKGVRIYCTDAKGHGREVLVQYAKLKWAARTDIEPVPEIPGNSLGIFRTTRFNVFGPFDLKGLAMLLNKHLDASKGDEQWTYVPVMRRVRRMSVAQRCDSIAGTDLTWDDADIYEGEIAGVNEYKFIERKDMLVPRFNYPYPPDMKVNGLWVDNYRFCKRPVIVMEANSLIPNYCYTKRLWYIEPVSFRHFMATLYDRKQRLWKVHMTGVQRDMSDTNNPANTVNGINYIDIQSRHASPWLMDSKEKDPTYGPYQNSGFIPEEFSVEYLRKAGH